MCDGYPHMQDLDHRNSVMRMLKATNDLRNAPCIKKHMLFSTLWRDYLTLRALAIKTGIWARDIHFIFECRHDVYPIWEFHARQTMAAIKNISPQNHEDTPEEYQFFQGTVSLVVYGCRGINVHGLAMLEMKKKCPSKQVGSTELLMGARMPSDANGVETSESNSCEVHC